MTDKKSKCLECEHLQHMEVSTYSRGDGPIAPGGKSFCLQMDRDLDDQFAPDHNHKVVTKCNQFSADSVPAVQEQPKCKQECKGPQKKSWLGK